jgi:hypothetical protein
MMDWTKWVDKVDSLISKYGADITIKVGSLASFDVVNDSWGTNATVDYITKGLFTDLTDKDEAGHITIIENGVLLVPANGLPAIDDSTFAGFIKIVEGSKTYQPKEIGTLQPGGTSLMYRLRIK